MKSLSILLESSDFASKEIVRKIGNQGIITHLTIIARDNQQNWFVGPPLSSGITSFTSLYDYDTHLYSLPSEVSLLKELKYLDISSLGIKKLPLFSELKQIERLDISFNPINIRDEIHNISQLSTLEVLDIRGCDFTLEDVEFLKEKTEALIIHGFEQIETDYFYLKKPVASVFQHTQEMLLKDIYNYYPIGIPSLNTLSSHYDKYQEAIKTKENLRWTQLSDKLKEQHKIIEKTQINAPSKHFSISLSDTAEKRKLLHIVFSVLSNHYTIYFETEYDFDEYASSVKKHIIYGEVNASIQERKMMTGLKQTILDFYPKYNFVDHYLLSSSKVIGGIPYGFDTTDSSSFSIYALLFGDDFYLLNDEDILE